MIMDKRIVDTYLDKAYEAIKKSGILENGKVKKSYRSQISAFGASISMGSTKAAIAFFSKQGGSEIQRPRILYAIYLTLNSKEIYVKNDDNKFNDNQILNKQCCIAADKLFKGLNNKNSKFISYSKEDILNAAIAVKLAMNLYELEEK